jgi:hypothetical protein
MAVSNPTLKLLFSKWALVYAVIIDVQPTVSSYFGWRYQMHRHRWWMSMRERWRMSGWPMWLLQRLRRSRWCQRIRT